MSREASPRRRLSPAVLLKTPSQDRLIAELQDRLGIRPEAEGVDEAGADAEAWLTEGVVITVQPRGRRDGGQVIEKVVFPPDSPIPLRRTISVPVSPPPSPSLQYLRHTPESGPPSPQSPPTLARTSPEPLGVKDARDEEGPLAALGPLPSMASVSCPPRTPAAARLTVSVGCQTDDDPLFPPVQAGCSWGVLGLSKPGHHSPVPGFLSSSPAISAPSRSASTSLRSPGQDADLSLSPSS
ncbi:uncharacterized protein LOC144457211, partial [Phascolarctos cinereus]